MKITAIILLCACLAANANGHAQKVTFSGKNVPLETVFTAIKKQTGYVVFYEYSILAEANKVTIGVKNVTVEKLLDECFKQQPFTYAIEGKTILVTKKDAMIPAEELPQPPTPIDVKGRVVNEKGEPVSGASVQVKGDKTKGTSTDADGYFILKNIDENVTLIISAVNIEEYTIKVNGKTDLATLNVITRFTTGEDVKINTGYQQVKPNEVTGSVVQINNKLLNRSVSTDIISRLKGITSGLLFNGNAIDQRNNISIRGRNTIYANTQPLIVLDNFPYTGDLNTINPNDIESITVLKDAAAASVWGAYSGNGVIVITSKKGKYNQPVRVGLNTSITIGEKPDLFYDQQFLNSSEFINNEIFLFGKGYYDADIASLGNRPISPAIEILARRRAGLITSADSSLQITALKDLDIRNDYLKYLYQKSVSQQYALNLSGGTSKSNYYFSAGYNRDASNVKANQNERISFQGAATFKPLEGLEINGGIVYTQSNSRNNGLSALSAGGRFSNIYPYAQIADANGNPLPVVKDYRYSFVANTGVSGLLDWRYFPLKEIQNSDSKSNSFDNRLFAGITYRVIKGLNIGLKYQHQKATVQGKNYYSEETYFTRNLINQFSVVSGASVVQRNLPLGGILSNTSNNIISNSGRAQIAFDNKGISHTVSAIAGIDISERSTNGFGNLLYGYDATVGSYISNINYDTYYPLYPSGGSSKINNGSGAAATTIDRFRSFFANAAYAFKDRYTVSASTRLDQANIFGVKTNQKGTPLWSSGIKWDIDKESFYHIKWLPSLKLRLSYGYRGNIDRSTTAYPTAVYLGFANLNGLPQAAILSPGNPQLRWEKMGMLNAGIDFQIGKKLLSGSIEYFHKKGIDMIGNTTVPSSTGYTSTIGNYSNMKGNGIDIILNGGIHSKNFEWNSTLLFSYATDKITRNEGISLQIVGRPVSGMYAYQWGGLDGNGDPMGYLSGNLSKDYAAIINLADINPGVGYKYVGPYVPQIYGSFRNTFEWRKIEISANIIYKTKYYFRRTSISYSSLFENSIAHSDYQIRWQNPGDEAITSVPALVYPTNLSRDAFYLGSEATVEKGDHIRLQDISLSYTLDKTKWKKLPFNSLRFYFYANNLGIIWKANKRNIDPDFSTGYPSPRTYSFGINVEL